MRRKNHSPEQTVRILREADARIAVGQTVEQVCIPAAGNSAVQS